MDPSAVARYHELERLICQAENEHVESQYHVSEDTLNKLQYQYDNLKKKYAETHKELKKQVKKEHQYTDKGPNLKKFGARITGQLAKKQHAKKELVEELQKKDESYQHDVEVLQAQVQEAKRAHMKLEQRQAELLAFRAETDDLLHKIFDGPCGSPQENACENEMIALHNSKHEIGKRKSTYEKSRRFLAGGVKQLGGSLQMLRMAGFNNKLQLMDNMFGDRNDGMFGDIMKQRRINQAKMLLMEAKQNVINAKNLVPEIPRVDNASIQTFGLLADMIFDGVIGDMMQQRRIRESMNSIENSMIGAQFGLQWMDATITQSINPQLDQTEKAYFAKRQQLKQIRVELIRTMQIASGVRASQVPVAPPAYTPVSSVDSFTPAQSWTTGDITAEETKTRALKNAASFDLSIGEFGDVVAAPVPAQVPVAVAVSSVPSEEAKEAASCSTVHEWLQSIGPAIADYEPALVQYGYDSMAAVKAASTEELAEALNDLELNGAPIKVKKPHQKMIIEAQKNM